MASFINTISATIKSARPRNIPTFRKSAPVITVTDCPRVTGSLATMPEKIKKEIPFDKPYSVISSPNQTANMEPAVIERTKAIREKVEKVGIMPWLLKSVYIPNDCKAARGTVRNRVY